MTKHMKTAQLVVAFGMGLTLMGCGEGDDGPNTARAQTTGRDFVAPIVFQAAGPDIASIQNTVEQYRTALDVSGGKTITMIQGRSLTVTARSTGTAAALRLPSRGRR